jgi:Bacterial Ig-like domain
MRRLLAVASVALLGAITTPVFEPPKVVSTSPKFWETGVSPISQKTVSVRFDQIMRSGFWDFLGNNVLPPPTNYETMMGVDLKSFGLQVSLQPGKVYIMGLNERGIPGVGFQNDKGISLKPTYLVFQTAGKPAPENAPPHALNTFPANGAEDVNPANGKGITVTFDRGMEPTKHGFYLFEEGQPVDLRRVTFTYSPDGKIFTLNYPLKPSTRYDAQMNSTEDIGFAATNRVPLWPVHFAFTTSEPR